MGIKGLTKLLAEQANGCIKEHDLKHYMGRTVAIDASMWLYQFLIAVRTEGAYQMTNEAGEVTSHIIGMFYRTIRLCENGIKPVFVFDGKPPEMKSGELKKRKEAREKAQAEKELAEKNDDMATAIKMERRLVRVNKTHCEDVKKLLKLMNIPYVEASCEAEATCAWLAKAGLVWGVGTEDMDALTFGTPILLRGLHHSASRKQPIKEIRLDRALAQMEFTMDQFVDLCILCGCDYTTTIRGIGPKSVFKNIKENKTIEQMIEKLDKKRYNVPEDFNFVGSREMFKNPDVTDPATVPAFTWKDPDREGLIKYLHEEKGFAVERVEKGIDRLKKSKGKSNQKRLDMFFKVLPNAGNKMKKKMPTTKKRKASTLRGNTAKKKRL